MQYLQQASSWFHELYNKLKLPGLTDVPGGAPAGTPATDKHQPCGEVNLVCMPGRVR
jgi:hypothetical protein